MEFLKKVWEVVKKVFICIWNLLKVVFVREGVINFMFKALEIIFAGALALFIVFVINIWFTLYTAIAVSGIVFYFFSPIIKPYFDRARKWIIAKWTGIDCE